MPINPIKIELMDQFDYAEMAQILELFRRIPGRTCSAAAFLDYMARAWGNIKLIVLRRESAIVGFTLAVKPSILEPKIGWLPFSSVLPAIPSKYTKLGFKTAEQWLIEQGADVMRFTSVRKPTALKKNYGVEPSREVLYEKQLRD